MTNTKENDFIESIKFEKDFLPFKNGDKIKFGGEEEMGKIIEFYLKDKTILDSDGKEISAEDNAKRFKINCVLGNNGGGKSRLFEGFFESKVKKYTDDINELGWSGDNLMNRNIIINNGNINLNNYEFILDDFFIIGNSFLNNKNTNRYLATGNIYIENNTPYNKVLMINYLLELNNYPNLLKIFNKNINDIEFKWGEYGYELDLTKYFRMYFLYNKNSNSIKEINKKIKDEKDKNEKDKLLKGKLKFINFKGSLDDVFGLKYGDFEKYNNIIFKFKNYINNLSNKNDFNINLLEFILDKFLFSVYFKKGEIKKSFSKNITGYESYSKSLKYHANILNKLLKYSERKYLGFIENISNNINIKLFIKYIYEIESDKISFYEKINFIELISSTVFYNINLIFNKNKNYQFNNLSAGEKTSFLRIVNIYSDIIYNSILDKEHKNFTILIDEPDLHLHLDWQKKYIQKLIDVFSTLDPNIKLHFIIATHSPFIISDLPSESIIILDGSEKNKYKGKYTEIKEYENKTFGANFVDIIRDGFFFKDEALMGSFSESVIGSIADDDRKQFMGEGKKYCNINENKIGDEFLRDNLLYFKGKK